MVNIDFYYSSSSAPFRFTVKPDDTIASFKMQVYEKYGDLPWNQVLFLNDDTKIGSDAAKASPTSHLSSGFGFGQLFPFLGAANNDAKTFSSISFTDEATTYSARFTSSVYNVQFYNALRRSDPQRLSTLLETELTPAQLIAEGVLYYYMVGVLKSERKLTIDDLNSLGSDGLAPVHIAATKKVTKLIQLLHAKGANLDLPSSKGETALHIAAKSGDLATAEWLVKNGANLNAQDTDGSTPLHIAVENLRLDMVELLCTSGAALDVLNNQGDAPVHIAASKADGSAFVFLLDKAGANIDIKNSRTGETALFVAAANGHLEVVKTLLKLGADPTTQNAQGRSAVTVSRSKGQNYAAQLLQQGWMAFGNQPSLQKAPSSAPGVSPYELASMQKELEELRAQKENMLRLEASALAFELLQQYNADLRCQVSELQSTRTANLAQIDSLGNHNRYLFTRCAELEASLASSEAKVANQQRELEEQSTRSHFEALKQKSLNEQVTSLQAELAAAKQRCEQLEQLQATLEPESSSSTMTVEEPQPDQ